VIQWNWRGERRRFEIVGRWIRLDLRLRRRMWLGLLGIVERARPMYLLQAKPDRIGFDALDGFLQLERLPSSEMVFACDCASGMGF
jgi:hypothetical protein